MIESKRGLVVRLRSLPVERQFLVLLLVLFVIKQLFTVVIFPPFTGHDEVVHYAYVRMVATEHRVPVIPDLNEWRQAWQTRSDTPGDILPLDLYKYQRYVLDWCCNPDDRPEFRTQPPAAMSLGNQVFPNGWQYAANHPPLYYVLMTPLYAATDTFSPVVQQYVIRSAAIPIGMLIIVLTFLMAGLLFPRDRFIMMVAPTFVTFQTQFSYESAMVNNDILLIGMFTLITWLLVRGIRKGFTIQSTAVIGLVLGLGLLAKASMLSAAPLIAVAIILGVGYRNVRRWAPFGAMSISVAALVSWPWYLYLYRTYGNFSALEQVKALQYSWTYTDDNAPSILDQLWNKDFAQDRWKETWGEFGWRLIHLHDWLLTAIGLPLLVMAIAALVAVIVATIQRAGSRSDRTPLLSREQCLGLWLMVAVTVLAYGAMLQFGTTFKLTQARYFFNAVGAVAILLAFGFRTIVPGRFHNVAASLFLICMIAANVMIYSQSVIPYWYLAT